MHQEETYIYVSKYLCYFLYFNHTETIYGDQNQSKEGQINHKKGLHICLTHYIILYMFLGTFYGEQDSAEEG